jgi:hypothetical protein
MPAVDGTSNSLVPKHGLESGVIVSEPDNLMIKPPYHNTIQSNLSNNDSGNQESRVDVPQGVHQVVSAPPLTVYYTNFSTQSTTRNTVTQVESIPQQPKTTNIPISQSEINTHVMKPTVKNNGNHQLQHQNGVFGFTSVTALPLNACIKSDNEGAVKTQDIHYPHHLVNQNPATLPRFSLNMIHTQTGYQDCTEDGERTVDKYNSSNSTQPHKPYEQEPVVCYKQSNPHVIPGFPNQVQNIVNIPVPKSRQQSLVRQISFSPPQQQYFQLQTPAPSELSLKRAVNINVASIPQAGNTSHRYRKYSGSTSYFDRENSLRSIEEGRGDFENHSLGHSSEVRDHFSKSYLVNSQGFNQNVAEPYGVGNLKHSSTHGESVPVCSEFSKTNLIHSNSVADFRQFHHSLTHRNSLADRRFRTISMSQVSMLDDSKGARLNPKKSFGPIQKWSSFSNLEKVDKTGIAHGNISDATKQCVKGSIHEWKPPQPRRKLPVPPHALKPFDIKHSDSLTPVPNHKLSSYQISNKHASTGDLTTNEPIPHRPQYRRCTSIEASTSQDRFPSQHLSGTTPVVQHHCRTGTPLNTWHSTTDIIDDINGPFRKLIKPSHPSLSQESLDSVPLYPQPQNNKESSEHFTSVTDNDNAPPAKRTAKPCYLSLCQEPRDLLRAKLKQAKSMSNLALFNKNQATHVSPNPSPTSSPSLSRPSLHPNDAFSIHQNRNEIRTHMPHSEYFHTDSNPVYHTIHAGMKPPKYLMEWERKRQYSGNKDTEDVANLSEANSDDMEYLDSRSYFEGEESQDDDMFYSHIIPSSPPHEQENHTYRFHRDAEDYVDEEGNLQTNPILRSTLEQTLKAECLDHSQMAATKPELQFDTSHEDILQTQHNNFLKLKTSAAEQIRRRSEAKSQKYEEVVPSQLHCSGDDQVILSGGRFENANSANLDSRRRNEHPAQYVSGHRSLERNLFQQTMMVRNSSIEKIMSGNGKGEVPGFGACWVMGACAFFHVFVRK